jgi:hypothetical protein
MDLANPEQHAPRSAPLAPPGDGAIKNRHSAPDEPPVRAFDHSSAAAIEKRRLPGFQGVAAITADGTIVYVSPSVDGLT